MSEPATSDYPALDRPEVLLRLFHPRPEYGASSAPAGSQDILIPVEDGAAVGARFHLADHAAANILFFHGNGEIVADYDELGPRYNGLGLNFLPVDYRGYGRSTGSPTVTAMLRDCHRILAFAREWLGGRGYPGRCIVMGRSLGSAPALELAASHPEEIEALVVESGFADTRALLAVLGVDVAALSLGKGVEFHNLDKIRVCSMPTLIIHGEDDQIIPFRDGQSLYNACPARDKTLLKIPGAGHNDLLLVGYAAYMTAIRDLAARLRR